MKTSLKLKPRLTSTVTNKFRDVVGRVTPCAPFGKLSADRGAHGVTCPTRALHEVTKLICRGTRAGSILVVTLLLGAILVLTLGGYLWWVRTQNLLVAESQAWNSALALAEAGIEEGMAQINVLVGTDYVTNYMSSVSTNFPQNGTKYGPLLTARTLTNGSYTSGSYNLIIIPPPVGADPGAGPTIISTGYTKVPMISQPIARVVEVLTAIKPQFGNGISVLSNIDLSGNHLTVDSFNSTDTNHSTANGTYDPATRTAHGDLASLWGLISVQNANVYGHLYTGPSGSATIGLNGSVGDLNWVGPGIESGYYQNDFNMDVPDVQPPYTNGLQPNAETTNTYTLGNPALPGSSYSYYWNTSLTLKSGETLNIAPSNNVTLYLTGSLDMQSQNNSYLNLGQGASLRLYVGTTSGSATKIVLTQVNNPGKDSQLQILGLPSLTSVSWNGNAAFSGVLYAPEADFSMGGGGGATYDFQGALTARSMKLNGHFNLHYDEYLRKAGVLSSEFTVTYWQELPASH